MVGGIMLIAVAVACIISVFIKDKLDYKYKDKVVSSQMLGEEVDKERGEKLPRVNALNGSANTYARRDKSWSSLPDFVVKLIKGWRKKG